MARVLFDISVLATETRVRGIGRYVTELALGLERYRHDYPDVSVQFLEWVGWNGGARISDSAAASIEQATSQSAVEPHKRWAYRFRLGAARAVRISGAALLHQGHPNVTPLGRLHARRLVTCHDLIPLMYPDQYLDLADGFAPGRRWLDRRRYGTADHVLAISEATACALQDILGIDATKISVVPNGIDLEHWRAPAFSDARRPTEARDGRYFLYVGDGDWRKNHERLFQALRAARDRLPRLDLRLVWAGKLSGERQRQAMQHADRAGVGAAVTLLGYVPDAELQALYAGALATVFVSLAEGFGLPVLEAMALGSPVITSDRSSLIEVAEGAALLVDPTGTGKIADALCRLAVDDALRTDLAAKGLERSRRFTLERQVRGTYAVYRRLLANEPAASPS